MTKRIDRYYGFEYGANQGDAQFLGVQVLREFSLGDRFMGRVGARAMTCINVADNAVNMALIEFQLGWGGETRAATMASASSVE
jgi:OOP family OmpA-OmpF porin